MDFQILEALVALVGYTEHAISIFDEADKLRYANASFQALMGLRADEQPTWSELMRLCYQHKRGTRIETDDFETWLNSID